MSSVFTQILKINGTIVTRARLRDLADQLARTTDKALTLKVRKAIKAMDQNGVRSARIEFDESLINKTFMPDTMTISELEGLYGIEVVPADLGEAKSGNTFFAEVSRRILDKIKTGTLPWRKPWSSTFDTPPGGSFDFINYVTGKPYRGANWQMCMMFGGGGTSFITEKQAKERGGKIVNPKAWIPICYFVRSKVTRTAKVKDSDGNEKTYTFEEVLAGMKWYKVFPMNATEGVKPVNRKDKGTKTIVEKPKGLTFKPVQAAERIVKSYPAPPPITHGGSRAVYQPATDSIQMPPKEAFRSVPEYYSTLFHELLHSTGHPKRLDRLKPAQFGTKTYAAEELVAELGASFLCSICRIDYFTLDNSAAYLKSWASKLEKEIIKDKQFFMKQQFASMKAVRYMMGPLWKTWNKTGVLLPGKPEATRPDPVSQVKKKGALIGYNFDLSGLSDEAKGALKYFKKHLAGKKIRNDHKGTVIILSMKGAKHSISNNEWSEAQLFTLRNFDKVIKTAVFEKYQAHKKPDPNIIGVHIYRSSINLNQAWYDIRIVVKVQKKGNVEYYYYDHHTFVKKRGLGSVCNRPQLSLRENLPNPRPYSKVQNPGQKSNRMRIVKAEDLAGIQIETMKLQGVWKDWLGEPALNFDLLLSGAPGGGKSTLLLQFAHYLANDLKKRVLFVSREEFGSATLAEKVQRLNIKNVHFTNTITPDARIQGDYDVVFVDSITDLRMTVDDYKKLREINPDVAFLLIAQQTKGGVFKGSNEWPHETEIVAEVADGKAWCTKNRYSMNKEPIEIPGYVQ